MPLVRHRNIDSWNRLANEGFDIVDISMADRLGLPRLDIGFLNMMPDRALRATERQFLRLLAAGGNDFVIYVHPFSIDGLDRQDSVRDYVENYYDHFELVKLKKLDGLVLTGANPGKAELVDEKFWPYFLEIIRWANACVPSTLCSCLASHAILNVLHGIERTRCTPSKRWGVYSHQLSSQHHPLTVGMDTPFDAPRSHVFEMTKSQLNTCEVIVLAESEEADFHIAVSADGLKWVFLQGHPEYDAVSLLKELKREVYNFIAGTRKDYPEFPKYYLNDVAVDRLTRYEAELKQKLNQNQAAPEFPESEVLPFIENTWRDAGFKMFENWLCLLHQNV